MEKALILERESPCPVAEIGRLLATHLGLHPTDAVARARYGAGILVASAPEEQVVRLQAALHPLGVRSRVVSASTLGIVPRGYRAIGLEFLEEAILARMVGGNSLVLLRPEIKAVLLHGRLPEGARPEPAVVKDATGGRKRKSDRREPAAMSSGLAGLIGNAMSPRCRQLVENLAEAGCAEMEFHLTIYCLEPIGPVRLTKDLCDFSCQSHQKQPHSLDNFLLLTDTLLDYLPDAWNREATTRLLQSLDPAAILRKGEEVANFDRWIFHWMRLEFPDADAAPLDATQEDVT